MISNTITRAVRFDWTRESSPLEGQLLDQHKAWLEVWQRVEIQDVHSFPLWEKEVHDVLQKRFSDLKSIFLAYCRSIGGSGSAEDAMEMQMAEFQDFVNECNLITKEVNFALMTITFTKANATSSALVAARHAEVRRVAAWIAYGYRGAARERTRRRSKAP